MNGPIGFIAAVAWIAGIAVAEGWATFFAILIPMVSWVFFAEWILERMSTC